jgi:integrase
VTNEVTLRHTGGGNTRGRKASFGSVRRLPSKRYQARYVGPDGKTRTAPVTFQTKGDANAWLSTQHADITRQVWAPETSAKRAPTVGDVAELWLSRPRPEPLKPRTLEHYRHLLDRFILPELGALPVTAVATATVDRWYAGLPKGTPTYRAHAYALLRSVLGYAVTKRYITANPAQITGAGAAKRHKNIKPATLDELETIAAHMPAKYRPMVMLASWCALRFGETAELRRSDLDLRRGVLHVRRGVVRVDGGRVVGTPKSDAGARDIAIPPHLVPMLKEHLASMPMRGQDALLFPAVDGLSHLAPSTLYRVFYPARQAAGRPDLRWHDLRHTGAVLAAQTGATLAELMGRLGHSTPAAALRYQHVAQGRDAEIAAALSRLADGATT